MMTFKQLEALYWVGQLGGFSQAAQQLHTTQSAVSKRVLELETLLGAPLFDRSQRSARLSEKGEEMWAVARRLLAERDAAVEQFARPEVVERRLRLGVTEITAMTWLPRLVRQIRDSTPRVTVEPEVETSVELRDKLLAGELDLAILPDAFDDSRFATTPLGRTRNAWMCKPGLLDSSKTHKLQQLAQHTLLVQGSRSGTGLLYERWFKSMGVTPARTIVSSNLIANISMAVSGLGVAHLPQHCLAPMVQAGMLEVLKVSPALPDVPYVAARKAGQAGTLLASVVLLAQACCDFDQAFQTG